MGNLVNGKQIRFHLVDFEWVSTWLEKDVYFQMAIPQSILMSRTVLVIECTRKVTGLKITGVSRNTGFVWLKQFFQNQPLWNGLYHL